MEPPEKQTPTTERRQNERYRVEGCKDLHVETSPLEGHAEDISAGGLLFTTGGPMVVTVSMEYEGKPVTFEGRLVRCHSMPDGRSGFAVEFDESVEL